MPALKNIGRISAIIGVSPLTTSPLWNQAVETITPSQITAFIWRQNELGKKDEAETAIEFALSEVHKAVARNEFGVPAMLSYTRPNRTVLTAGEIKDGLRYLGQPQAAAILFALETGLDGTGVAMLTWKKLSDMRRRGQISDLSAECTKASPRHVSFPYVFWQEVDGEPRPVFGLDHAVFEAFGLVWAELREGYANLIMIDGESDKKSVDTHLLR